MYIPKLDINASPLVPTGSVTFSTFVTGVPFTVTLISLVPLGDFNVTPATVFSNSFPPVGSKAPSLSAPPLTVISP